MAFDLNKNIESDKDSSDKNPSSSKFDLSKGDPQITAATETASKSKTWIIGLAGVLIVGAGIWYYSSGTKTANTGDSASVEVAAASASPDSGATTQAKAQSDGVVTDTTVANPAVSQATTANSVVENPVAGTQTVSASGDGNASALNNKIPVTFAQGSSSFVRVDQSLIKRVISYLTKNPDASINVNGYASSDGSLEINQTISQQRADAFKKYLVSRSIVENRIVATGKGIENPVASNDSDTGRKKNRRVEITFP